MPSGTQARPPLTKYIDKLGDVQAKRVSDQAPSLLLLDVLDLRDHGAGSLTSRPRHPDHGSLELLPDPGLAERLYASLPHAAFSICLSWLPALAHALLTGIAIRMPTH